MKKKFLRLFCLLAAVLLILTACGAEATPVATVIPATETSIPPTLTPTNTPQPTETPIPPTPTIGVGSTMISDKDGMTLLYVPAGEFTMGSEAEEVVADGDELGRFAMVAPGGEDGAEEGEEEAG